MIRRTTQRKVRDSYLELIQTLPLRPLRNEADYDTAVAIMNRLAVRDEGTLDQGEQDYFDTLVMIVESYDATNNPIDPSQVSPVELLKGLMENRKMNVSDLGRVIGSQPLASMILSGKRAISRKQAGVLGMYFGLNAGAFV